MGVEFSRIDRQCDHIIRAQVERIHAPLAVAALDQHHDVQETPDLRGLHDRLNQELSQRFANTQADHDGAAYHFHMTVAMGGQPIEVYRTLYGEIPNHQINRQFTARELVMFVYDDVVGPQGEYITYQILPLSG